MVSRTQKFFDQEEINRTRERLERVEAISYELLEICEKKGLTITEMTELAHIFPRLIKMEIKTIEQGTNFTVGHDQDWKEG